MFWIFILVMVVLLYFLTKQGLRQQKIKFDDEGFLYESNYTSSRVKFSSITSIRKENGVFAKRIILRGKFLMRPKNFSAYEASIFELKGADINLQEIYNEIKNGIENVRFSSID